MTDEQLDLAYTATCHALADVGPAGAQRFLAMLSLALMVRLDDADEVLRVIGQVRARCTDEPAGG